MKIFSRPTVGDDQIQALYREHGPGLLLYACSLLGGRHAAEDVLHQVFMNLIQRNSLPEEPKPYLFRAVHNMALNLKRDEKRDVDLADIEPWFEPASPDQTEQIALTRAIMQLPSEQRQVLVMHIWGGLSFEELSKIVAIPANTAASRYRYALGRLRAMMQTEDSDANS